MCFKNAFAMRNDNIKLKPLIFLLILMEQMQPLWKLIATFVLFEVQNFLNFEIRKKNAES